MPRRQANCFTAGFFLPYGNLRISLWTRSGGFPGASMVLAFGDHRLDIKRRELRRGDALVGLEPKVFDLLVFLVQHRDRVVSKDDLLEVIWGGRIVSESALTTRINAVRRALGDDGAAQRLVRTFTRKGVRFIGEVTEIPDQAVMAAGDAFIPTTRPGAGDKPSIAVLPFANLSGDPEQEYFADGMVEEIITALSRIKWLFVIARNSSFTYKGQVVDVKQVGHELGVRYVLEGSVRKAGGRVRISAQLVDAIAGTNLWADRFDGLLEDVFELQDRIAVSVAGIIEPAMQAAEMRRSDERPTTDLTAYDLVLRAIPHVLSRERGRLHLALDLLGEAIERDARYGAALAWASDARVQLDLNGWAEDREAACREGVDLAHRAVRASPDDPEALGVPALTFGYFGSEDIETAKALIDRSVALSPSRAHSWLVSGWIRIWAGEPEIAIEHFNTSLRLNPRGLRPMHTLGLGIAHFFSRRFADALPELCASRRELPNFGETYRFLAATYAHSRRLDEARDMIAQLRVVSPALVARDAASWRNPKHRELLLSGLQLAGGL